MSRIHFPTRILCVLLPALLLLAACEKSATDIIDPCAPERVTVEAAKVNNLMREFDDAAQLAARVSQDQLVSVIPSLQEIRRRAEDQVVPDCLETLKTLQVTHMNTVVNTLLSFVGGADPDLLVQGIALARHQHEEYNQELARLLGATYVPPATAPAGADTPAAAPSAWVTNPGPEQAGIRAQPDVETGVLAWLDPGLSMAAVGVTEDGRWVQVVDSQGNPGWIEAGDVTVTGGEALPVVTPAP